MENFFISLIFFYFGFITRKLFDDRDIRREIIHPCFLEFEKTILYLQNDWRSKQRSHLNNKRYELYNKEFSDLKDRIENNRNNMICACKTIKEIELSKLLANFFKEIIEAFNAYKYFLDNRTTADPEERTELIKELEGANSFFDERLSKCMLPIYERYWTIISGIFISGFIYQILKLFKKIKDMIINSIKEILCNGE